MYRGDVIEVNCSKCYQKSEKHINEVYAVVNGKSTLLFTMGYLLVLFIVFLIALKNNFILMILTGIPIIFLGTQINAVKNFNSYRLKRKYD